MTIDNNTNENAENSEGSPHGASTGMRWVFIGGGIAWLALLVIAIGHPGITARVKFFSDSTLNLFIVLAVIAQVLIYRKQWDVMERQWRAVKEQTKAMRDAFYVGERAYLTIYDIAFIEKGEHPRIIYTLFNGGRTPAFEIDSESEASLGTEPTTGKLFTLGHPYGEKAFMPAGTKKQMEGTFPNFTVPLVKWQAINAGRIKLFVRGVVYYKDFQGTTHNLPFSVGYDPSLNRFRDYKAEDYSDNPD